MEPDSVVPASIASTRPVSGSDEVVGVLADDLRLARRRRQVAPRGLSALVELAFRAVRASRAGIAVFSGDGELVEHLTCGTRLEEATQASRSPIFLNLLRATMRQTGPTRIERFPC